MVVLNCLSLGSWKFFCSSHYNATISQLRDMEMVFSLYWVNLLSCCFLNIILWNQGVAGKALPWEASIPHVCLFVPWWRSPPSPVLCLDLGEQQKIAHVFGFLEPLWSKNKTKQTKKKYFWTQAERLWDSHCNASWRLQPRCAEQRAASRPQWDEYDAVSPLRWVKQHMAKNLPTIYFQNFPVFSYNIWSWWLEPWEVKLRVRGDCHICFLPDVLYLDGSLCS